MLTVLDIDRAKHLGHDSMSVDDLKKLNKSMCSAYPRGLMLTHCRQEAHQECGLLIPNGHV
jgi:hypothetical protein